MWRDSRELGRGFVLEYPDQANILYGDREHANA